MTKNPHCYDEIIDGLKQGGESYLIHLIQNQTENYIIDYKEVTKDFSNENSLGDYRKHLSKALSGFGNSEGGLLIFGVEDKSKTIRPFKGYKKFEEKIQEFIGRSTTPRHESADTLSFLSESSDNNTHKEYGYVVVIIPSSKNSPLQAIHTDIKNRYFYRSGESFEDIPHTIISGLFSKHMYRLSASRYYEENNQGERFYYEYTNILGKKRYTKRPINEDIDEIEVLLDDFIKIRSELIRRSLP